ncbi:MAG: hotdog fold thioesterase [Candidatus Marinimicrobia bacterium]|jgi:acyl-CoA thioesterase|nr:hotdog fold thioesterase [Candidatus Neomarinimicrobiota bacterium]
MNSPKNIVQYLYKNDAYSQWLGIEIIEVKIGYCKLKMKVRKEMLNGFKITHGGISYSLADTALAFASNTHGKKCISMETSISHIECVQNGDCLTAVSKELSKTEKTALYLITIFNQNKQEVAYFKGTVYRTSKDWEIHE